MRLDNSVKDLTGNQLRGIDAGGIKNWQEVGGLDAPIVVVGHDTSSRIYGTWQEMVVEKGMVKGERSYVTARAGDCLQWSYADNDCER